MRRLLTACVAASVLAFAACSQPVSSGSDAEWNLIGDVPHDSDSFTQGIEIIDDGVMAESSGLYGKSRVTTYRIDSGEVLGQVELPEDQFGEGLTRVGDHLLQGTWKEGVVHVWSLPDLAPVQEIVLDGETWGLCHDADAGVVWRSDGTSTLQGLSPETLEEVTSFDVDLKDINELECVDGQIWANLWHTNDVVLIDPGNQEVVARYDLSELVEQAEEDNGGRFGNEQVLNGLAYDPGTGHFYVTGKQWPQTYIVEFDR